MKRITQVLLLTIIATSLTNCQKKSEDEGRPYEFGFTIDGEQHRYEKKDDKGIVQGEFGFITADGIYHVTVYATDENGKFKILSMRNIRISAPLDGSPFKGEISPEANKYRKQANLPLLPAAVPPSPNALAIPEAIPQSMVITSKTEAPFKFSLKPTIKPACAGCGLVAPEKFPQKPPPLVQTQDGGNFEPAQNFVQNNRQQIQNEISNSQEEVGQFEAPQYREGISFDLAKPGQYENTAVPISQEQEVPFEGDFQQQNEQNYPNNYVGGFPGAQQPQSIQPPARVAPAAGPIYKPSGDVSGQYPSGGNGGFSGAQQPQSIQPPAGVAPGQYQTAAGHQGTNYKPSGGVSGQYPSGGSAGFSGTQQPQSNQVSAGVAPGQYQTAAGPQGTNYKPSGDVSGQYPSGGSAGFPGAQQPQSIQAPAGVAPGQHQSAAGPLSGQYPSGGSAGSSQPNAPGQYQPVSGPQTTNYHSSGAPGYGNQVGFGVSANGGGSNFDGNKPEANPLQIPGQGPPTEVSSLPPITVSDNVIHVGGNKNQDIPIRDKFPGMQDGLPEGIEEKDITGLLYKFHYTVGFHGHYEKGLKNGAKIGGYFVNGRDGISRVVTYIADENGYRPKVKFINLGLDSDETPKPETEKKFGLKSFEFVWYPL